MPQAEGNHQMHDPWSKFTGTVSKFAGSLLLEFHINHAGLCT